MCGRDIKLARLQTAHYSYYTLPTPGPNTATLCGSCAVRVVPLAPDVTIGNAASGGAGRPQAPKMGGAGTDLAEVSTEELMHEVQRRLSCLNKPEKRLILIGACARAGLRRRPPVRSHCHSQHSLASVTLLNNPRGRRFVHNDCGDRRPPATLARGQLDMELETPFHLLPAQFPQNTHRATALQVRPAAARARSRRS